MYRVYFKDGKLRSYGGRLVVGDRVISFKGCYANSPEVLFKRDEVSHITGVNSLTGSYEPVWENKEPPTELEDFIDERGRKALEDFVKQMERNINR